MSKTMFPLFELNMGDIIYQYSAARILPRGITIGVAERNLYVDKNHEINLCVYWNTRIPAKYEFNNKYSFYITDGRIASDIFCSLIISPSFSFFVYTFFIKCYYDSNDRKEVRV